ncbi:MAG: SCO family protein [Methylobacterium sp.]|nr:SCO family protein [Methylobacterium sp.]MCA3605136.1 SCO family protein [Methylobacterium sp.]MCA3608845.1 SCO family protein [Methylobacterium sp.]MCA3611015.1 SCO family protein [Methylobacterium sp.]MCA3619356.1 SCO family protein [Methylobacterium sp.]
MNALKIVRITAWAAIGIITVALLYVLLNPVDREQGTGVASIGGPFRLADHDGQIVTDVSLRGKPYALFFGFTHCPDVCPTSMLEITNDLDALGNAAKDFRVYFVTVDPARDTAALLKEYTGSFDRRIIGLVPKDEAELANMARLYRAIYRKVDTPSGYTMDHTASIYLMDAKGQFFGTLDSKDTPAVRQAKLKRLLERR